MDARSGLVPADLRAEGAVREALHHWMADSSQEHTAEAQAATLPPTLRLGPVHLTVTDLDRSIPFYERSIGLRTHRRDAQSAAMGAGGEDVLWLHEDPSARPAGRHAGLYHYAFLHPSRLELARAAQRLLVTETPISGASDHGISEAIYLPDPDGIGIELAADRPRERWGDLRDPATIGPRPLDLNGLLEQVAGEQPRPAADPALKIGHVHLHVGDVDEGLRFYRDVIGFEPMSVFPTAAFVSAGGYHHHVSFNTWRGEGVPPAPSDAVGLRRWTVLLDDQAQVDEVHRRVHEAGLQHEHDRGVLVRDPSSNALLITTDRQ